MISTTPLLPESRPKVPSPERPKGEVPSRRRLVHLYAGVFFTTLSLFVFEIALTKLFSVLFWYHFAYLAVSISLFGLGAGGLLVHFRFRDQGAPLGSILSKLCLIQAAAMTISLTFLLNVPLQLGLGLEGLFHLLLVYLATTLPFTIGGLTLALLFRYHRAHAARIYAADLLGSALGCLAFLAAISFLSGPSVILLAASLATLAWLFFERFHQRILSFKRLGAVGLALLSVGLLERTTSLFEVKYTKLYEERQDLQYESWSPLARITVYPDVFWYGDEATPFGWGMSPKWTPKRPVKQLWIEQDASAGTPITHFDGDFDKVDFLRHDITSLPYHIKSDAAVFVVGAGGGRDVLTALSFECSRITAVDINPTIIDLVRDTYGEFAGHIYDRAEVQVHTGDARHFIQHSDDHYDIIQISLIDTWAATAAGGLSLSENALYTKEAFVEYLEHLTDEGVLSVTRYLFTPRNQCLRVVTLARSALEELGVENPHEHVAVLGSDEKEGLATVLVKKTPFHAEERENLHQYSDEYGFPILYLSDHPVDPAFRDALESPTLETFLAAQTYDLSPPTDDRPFFFQMVPLHRALDLFFDRDAFIGQRFNYFAQTVLVSLLFLSILLVGIFYFVPLILSKRTTALPASWGAYFTCLGLAFMLVEIPWIQKGALYLGHPTYGLSIVLASILIFGGLGSFFSGRLSIVSLRSGLPRVLGFLTVLIITSTLLADHVLPSTIHLSLSGRITVVVLMTGSLSFLMGMAFPSGLRLSGSARSRAVPWIWALNGGASVLGSVLAMLLAMSVGYRITLLSGAALYAVAWMLMRSLSSRGEAVSCPA